MCRECAGLNLQISTITTVPILDQLRTRRQLPAPLPVSNRYGIVAVQSFQQALAGNSRALLADTATDIKDMKCDHLVYTTSNSHSTCSTGITRSVRKICLYRASLEKFTQHRFYCFCTLYMHSESTRTMKSGFMLFVRQSLIMVCVATHCNLSPPLGYFSHVFSPSFQ